MKKNSIATKIALCSVAAVICVAGQSAFAHTGIKDKVFVEGVGNTGSGASAYNAFTVSHGCASNAIPEGGAAVRGNVIAVGALFPNSPSSADAIIYRYKTGSIVANTVGVDGTVLTGQPTSLPVVSPSDLTDDINGAVAGAAFSNMGLGLVTPNLFGSLIIPKVNDTLAIRGYAVFNGPVQQGPYSMIESPLQESIVSTTGLSAFKFNVPTFKTTSCAKNLIVRTAVSNWCKRGGGKKHDADRKDVWIGTDTGSVLYSMTGPDHGIMPNSRETLGMTDATLTEQGNGKSFWPSFTVTRNETTNPLPAACNGESYDVVVEPSGADIDANLTIKQGAYPGAAPGAKFE
ncbi:MAG: hypothetical protein Q7U57_00790 [Methylovulum sp.]|nr:hypothetical protein [Methylovulum sp.]